MKRRGPFEKPCARPGCKGIINTRWRSEFARRKFCSVRCGALVQGFTSAGRPRTIPYRARRMVDAFSRGYRRGYHAGYFKADQRWRQWLERHPVNSWTRDIIRGPMRGAA